MIVTSSVIVNLTTINLNSANTLFTLVAKPINAYSQTGQLKYFVRTIVSLMQGFIPNNGTYMTNRTATYLVDMNI